MFSCMIVFCFCVRQNAGGQRFQQADSVHWSTGVHHSLQRTQAGLRSDRRLDRSSLLPSAATHQHHQVYNPVLHQEGDISCFNIRNLHSRDTCLPIFLLGFNPYFPITNFFPQITLFKNYRPAVKTFRSTTSTFFFLAVLLLGWGLAIAVMVYSMSE